MVVGLSLSPPPPYRQTLGGSSGNPSPAPLKGDAVYKTQNNEATLRKMKLYGGSMFYDK